MQNLTNPYYDLLGDWWDNIKSFISVEQFNKLGQFINAQYKVYPVYPPKNLIFRAFIDCPFSTLKVVIVGQDPYPKKNLANGLSFGISDLAVDVPYSLKAIYEEIEKTSGFSLSFDYSLKYLAAQGVLLLNTGLTVLDSKPESHLAEWRFFTEAVFKAISTKNDVVFLLFGGYAKSFKHLIASNHPIILAPHPAAGAYDSDRSIVGSDCFVKVNNELNNINRNEIKW